MNDLLKEAIADAKAVRTTALANAKMALEEAFTPKLQSMISAKIREEAEYDELEEDEMEDNMDIPMDEMEDEMEEGGMREDEHEMDEMEDEMEEGGMREDDMELDMEGHHEGMREDEHEMDEMRDDEPVAEEDDLELEAIIKELEDEIDADVVEEEFDNEIPAEEDGAAVSESNDTSSAIGTADNKQPAPAASADNTDDPEGTGVDTLAESEDGMEGESETINNLTEKLQESYSVVKFLRSKINEVNLLNAKLLFTNKLFRNGNLNESQKLKVIETFDRAKSTREVKLVYTTLAESTMATRTSRKRKAVKEGFASKRVGSTKPRRSVLNEGADMASRFKKLAGLTK